MMNEEKKRRDEGAMGNKTMSAEAKPRNRASDRTGR